MIGFKKGPSYPCAIATTMIDDISIAKPNSNTLMVEPLTPFHSLSSIPQTLEKVTLSAIKMLHEKANNTGLSIKKLFPISKPKN